MKRLLILSTTLALLAATGCGGDKKTDSSTSLVTLRTERDKLDEQIRAIEAKQPDTGRKVTPITVLIAEPQNFDAFTEVQATITGDENVIATPQAPGTVTSIKVRQGQHVGRGAVLATLDAGPVEQQILAQDAQLTLARTVYEKQQKLWKEQIGTEIQLLQAKANYESATKQRAALVAQRNMYRIVSPISGTVDDINLKVGDIASPGGGGVMGIRVVDQNKLKAEANLGENYLGKISTGDPVTLIFPDMGDSIRTKISYASQAVDPVSRSFNVIVRLSNQKFLHPNMSCRMRITNYEASNAITVPVSVIQNTAEGSIVYIVSGDEAKSVKVKTGKTARGYTEITSGLSQGDKVIVEGYQDLNEGDKVSF